MTGVESTNISEPMQSSDQMSFVAKGVPAVQIFTAAHADYHRPGDTADKIDAPGLVKVATFVKEGVAYLAERPEPLTVTIARRPRRPPPAAARPAAAGPPGELRHRPRLRLRGARRARERRGARLTRREGRPQGR